jgi:endonuclease-3
MNFAESLRFPRDSLHSNPSACSKIRMSTNRAARINKLYKVLKKHYKPVTPPERPVLEHLLYACCLQNATHEAADESFAKLQESYFDWNEVRVTTAKELSETMSALPDPLNAANRLKRVLQGIFEAHYTFDIDSLKKQNLGKAVKELENLNRIPKFALDYVTQIGLGGHSIPCNEGVMQALLVLDVVTPADVSNQRVPGLERAIPKTKGVEFASLLHQLGTEYGKSPFATHIRSVLTEVDAGVKDRFPKRGKKSDSEEAAAPRSSKTKSPAPKKPTESAKKKSATKKKTTTKGLTKRKPR